MKKSKAGRPKKDITYFLRCSACGQVFHKTTTKLDFTRSFNGSMFKLLDRYGVNGENWEAFPNSVEIQGDCLVCPSCYSPYKDIRKNLYRDKEHTIKARFSPSQLGIAEEDAGEKLTKLPEVESAE